MPRAAIKRQPTILIADDHPETVKSLQEVLPEAGDVIAVASDGRSLLALARKHRPDIVTDNSIHGVHGVEAVRRLKKILPDAKIIFFTARAEENLVTEAFRAGAAGYVVKGASHPEEILRAVEMVAHGNSYFPSLPRGKTKPAKDRPRSAGLTPRCLTRVIDFVNNNMGADIGLRELAEIADISPHYFSQRFKESTGITPHQYLVQQRIEKAKKLLANAKLTLSEIGVAVGFTDQSHFTNVFRKNVGTTPRRWREQKARRSWRRRLGDRTWHRCPSCSTWPWQDFVEMLEEPASEDLCNECKTRFAANDC